MRHLRYSTLSDVFDEYESRADAFFIVGKVINPKLLAKIDTYADCADQRPTCKLI